MNACDNSSTYLDIPVNDDTLDEGACWYSSSSSTYLDPNVIAMYPQILWNEGCIIRGGDACNDLCYTEECGFDSGCDANTACLKNSDCGIVYYNAWLLLAGSVYEMSHDEICATKWDMVMFALQYDPETHDPNYEHSMYWEPPRTCEETLSVVDYNEDLYMNFREFVSAALYLYGVLGSAVFSMNCSSCVGMDYYNPVHHE